MQTNLEIRNVCIEGNGPLCAIGICGPRIAYIGEPQDACLCIDGQGLTALSGAIDGHTHFRGFSECHKEDWYRGTEAAFRGGVTTILDMGNHPGNDAVTTCDAFGKKASHVSGRGIDFRLWFMAMPEGEYEFRKVRFESTLKRYLAGIKLCMETTTGGLLVEKLEDQKQWCEIAAETGTLIAAHVGIESIIRENRRKFPNPATADHCQIREAKGEIEGGVRFLELLEKTGACGEIKHVSTPELVREAKKFRERGVNVSLEICPHHWLFSEEQLQREDGAFFKMNPPLRTVDQVRELLGFLADGTIDTIATDHAPHTKEEKMRPRYDNQPSGVPGVQEMLPLGMELVNRGVITLPRLVDLTMRNPARLYGLQGKGELREGYDADIVLVNPKERSVILADELQSKCGWSPYTGMPVYGKPKFVMARGEIKVNHL